MVLIFSYVFFAHEPCATKDPMTSFLGVPLIGLGGVVEVGVLLSAGQERFASSALAPTGGA